ncbi:hypothetical protein L2750_16110 [Shewanella submarina]|uniref:Uncharacterized protein n=1 Tax=Shewanella submarina TaxID=2016376 RepID=A0ABV7GG08_9GAMM|nr:hypothetical protein [Shewanella submarina]MCL1038654.1 hypothetical protein [Shewanella submarina]
MVKEYFYGKFGDDLKWFWLDAFFFVLALVLSAGAIGFAGWVIKDLLQKLF